MSIRNSLLIALVALVILAGCASGQNRLADQGKKALDSIPASTYRTTSGIRALIADNFNAIKVWAVDLAGLLVIMFALGALGKYLTGHDPIICEAIAGLALFPLCMFLVVQSAWYWFTMLLGAFLVLNYHLVIPMIKGIISKTIKSGCAKVLSNNNPVLPK